MQDRSIDNALLALHRQLHFRTDAASASALAHLSALLAFRSLTPSKRYNRPCAARPREMSRLVTEALREGPLTYNEIAEKIAKDRPNLSPTARLNRTSQCLARLKKTRSGVSGRAALAVGVTLGVSASIRSFGTLARAWASDLVML